MPVKTYEVWYVEQDRIPCPFTYSQGRNRPEKPCSGRVATIWRPVFHKRSGAVDYGHFHLTCTNRRDGHGSPEFGLKLSGDPSNDPLKYWPDQLPDELAAIVSTREPSEG